MIITITKAIACGQRVQGVIDSVQGEYKTDKKHETKNGLPKVEFRNVSFRYPSSGELLLKNISFSVNAGDTVGIIGATGSGKTTLVNLIPAFYDVTDGEVLLDGINVTDIDKLSLRKRFGIVPQTATLVKDTLRENLNWRNADATDEEIMRIAKLACVDNVILDKKDGLDSYSDQMGKNFSGGQRQRLTVARALVGEPEILILDDSSSALDYATDAALRRAIASLPYEHTTFIVSQRTSAILDADKIIVLDDGEIIGIGTHDELYNNCITYREIHDLQFSSNGDGE